MIVVNRYGLRFRVGSGSTRTYVGSGRRFASYYRRVCLRCGWSFAGVRWKGHRIGDCNDIRRERKVLPHADEHARANLRRPS